MLNKRKESRGAHFGEDYPVERQEYNKRLFISGEKNGLLSFTFLDE
ncbi:hypothetical protein [Halobacillus sp. A5]|nr:hypothetical protein [Halobacillus sp. A5]